MQPPWSYEPLEDEEGVDWFGVVRDGDTERTFAAKTWQRASLLCELLNAIETCDSDSIVIAPVGTIFELLNAIETCDSDSIVIAPVGTIFDYNRG